MGGKNANKLIVSSIIVSPKTNEERKQQFQQIESKQFCSRNGILQKHSEVNNKQNNGANETKYTGTCIINSPWSYSNHDAIEASLLRSKADIMIMEHSQMTTEECHGDHHNNGLRHPCSTSKTPSSHPAAVHIDQASMQLRHSSCSSPFLASASSRSLCHRLLNGETIDSNNPTYSISYDERLPLDGTSRLLTTTRKWHHSQSKRCHGTSRHITRQIIVALAAVFLATSSFITTSHGFDLFSRQRPDHSSCSQQTCSASYTNSMQYVTRGPNPQFCSVLKTYLECMRQTDRACKGNLYYHSMSVLIINWMTQYNCSAMGLTPSTGGNNHRRPPSGKTRSPIMLPTPTALRVCTYKGERNFKHCGLFGDPHLRTFSNEFQTCKVEGAWPLIDNDYLVVQVTNAIVVHRSSATATSKLTVIIKGNTPCSEEKTYQATTGNLPSAFIDGHVTSGPDKSVQIVEMTRGRHIEIHIRYVATTVIVRQVGQFLTFAIRMPEIIIEKQPSQRTNNGIDVGLMPMSPNLQLCVRGCPSSERINYKEFLSYPNQKIKTLMRHNEIAMTRELAIIQCREAVVIDEYFDSCVFDLMTTGDANFTLAASSALKDVRQLHPGPIFKNRTSLTTHYQFLGNGGVTLNNNHILPILTCLMFNQFLAIP